MLLGHSLPRFPTDLQQRLIQGRKLLISLTGTDCGYDPSRWHEHLSSKDSTQYGFEHWDQSVPDLIAEAQARADWRAARAELELASEKSPNTSLERTRER